MKKWMFILIMTMVTGSVAHGSSDDYEDIAWHIAYDSINENSGTIYGDPDWTSRQIGDALLIFDANDDYAHITTNSLDSSFSLMCKPSVFDGGHG